MRLWMLGAGLTTVAAGFSVAAGCTSKTCEEALNCGPYPASQGGEAATTTATSTSSSGGSGGVGGMGGGGGTGGSVQVASRVFAGGTSSCALRNDGELWCWGDTHHAGVDITASPEQMPVARTLDYAASNGFACIVGVDEEAYCWGNNTDGQLGTGTTDDEPVAKLVQQLPNVQAISVGSGSTCALGANGGVFCWGDNSANQIPGFGSVRSTVPRFIELLGASDVVLGAQHACSIVAGAAVCWGANFEGQVDPGLTDDEPDPHEVVGAVAVGVGGAHSCAVADSGTVTCWGSTAFGQLSEPGPAVVQGLPGDVVEVDAGTAHTCVRTMSGEVWCWGQGAQGQLGDGQASSSLTPVQVAGLPCASEGLAVGANHACSMCADETVACWGENNTGQTGLGALGGQTNTATTVVFP